MIVNIKGKITLMFCWQSIKILVW